MQGRPPRHYSTLLSALFLASLALLAVVSPWLAPHVWLGALRASLVDLALTLVVAGLLGGGLGFLAGTGLRLAETLLGRGVEFAGALPSVLFAASALAIGAHFTSVALALGVLRGLEVAAALANELVISRELARLEAQSHVGLPLAVYYRSAFPRSLGPALTTLALTPTWLAAIDAALVLLEVAPLSHRLSLGALAARGELWPLALVLGLSAALYAIFRELARRIDPEGDSAQDALALPLQRRIPSEAPSAHDQDP